MCSISTHRKTITPDKIPARRRVGGTSTPAPPASSAPALKYVQDYDRWNQVLREYEFFHQPETLIRYRVHPGQDELKTMMEQAGLQDVEYFNLAAGIVALHRGYKY